MRADLALVARGFFETRAKAQEAITAGLVSVAGRRVRKAAEIIGPEAALVAQAPYPWVSRGGVKLAAALDAFAFDPQGQVCLDIGASTGGFTHVLLERGAAQVYAIDVGHGQLHPRIAADPRVVSREGTDARTLDASQFETPPRTIVCDASFISLRLILPYVLALAGAGAHLVALIKPQFEVGPKGVEKGLVKDEALREKACADVEAVVTSLGWHVLGVIPSPIEGGDGNREFLLGARLP